MRISDWSSDVCSSYLPAARSVPRNPIVAQDDRGGSVPRHRRRRLRRYPCLVRRIGPEPSRYVDQPRDRARVHRVASQGLRTFDRMLVGRSRSEEHTSELQSLMRISYAVFCLKKKQYKDISSMQLTTQLTLQKQ